MIDAARRHRETHQPCASDHRHSVTPCATQGDGRRAPRRRHGIRNGFADRGVPRDRRARRPQVNSGLLEAKPAQPALTGGNGHSSRRRRAAVDRDFEHAVYDNFPYVLAIRAWSSRYVLLARAFRSLVLPLKAVMLNLVSLAAAYGIVVFIFQEGHGSIDLVDHRHRSIIPWIPIMIFAFLYGISMDYEVFMLTRMREIYDETGDTNRRRSNSGWHAPASSSRAPHCPHVRVPRPLVSPASTSNSSASDSPQESSSTPP